MVVFSKLVVMHMCSDLWVMAGGFRGTVLNCPCPREGGSCRRKSVLLVGGWVDVILIIDVIGVCLFRFVHVWGTRRSC